MNGYFPLINSLSVQASLIMFFVTGVFLIKRNAIFPGWLLIFGSFIGFLSYLALALSLPSYLLPDLPLEQDETAWIRYIYISEITASLLPISQILVAAGCLIGIKRHVPNEPINLKKPVKQINL